MNLIRKLKSIYLIFVFLFIFVLDVFINLNIPLFLYILLGFFVSVQYLCEDELYKVNKGK
ncbi:MAG: hypothetical protein KatS3mg002_0997 [Candidatus Woesearchaeota archaeon]|jgi:hypothetical protein|nr:MAG: hypothetical protein KatS3mg002_0997 [Candidatus Woesearchaeota archaeon]